MASCLICGGITAHAPTGQPINGNVKIAGSVHITGLDGTASLSLDGGAWQSNSYAALGDLPSLQRLAPLPLVCPVGRSCSGSSGLVESLGATLKVARPVNTPAVTLSGGASLGQGGDQTYSADATRTGKGPLDLVFVPGFVSHVEYEWEYPPLARFLTRLASFSSSCSRTWRNLPSSPTPITPDRGASWRSGWALKSGVSASMSSPALNAA